MPAPKQRRRWSDEAAADLARSGITPSLAEALGVQELSAEESAAFGHEAIPALLFRYFDPFTNRFED